MLAGGQVGSMDFFLGFWDGGFGVYKERKIVGVGLWGRLWV